MAICGIFLIELYDRSQQSVIEFTHFISVNTFKMEIYDPNVQQGAISKNGTECSRSLFTCRQYGLPYPNCYKENMEIKKKEKKQIWEKTNEKRKNK